MALWGDKDVKADAPKYLYDGDTVSPNPATGFDGTINPAKDLQNAYFVDTDEAEVVSNRSKGIKTPGWNLVQSYVDSTGSTRTKVESLVVMKRDATYAGDLGIANDTDTEDLVVADSD